ncbi:hypothetical protein EOD41_13470 [Mucilaginibacter limnophilus]|uniref:Uncharacterized protein n=1 Tax=Mucilaginibacter limnophilus TaxID=1932778 RepID=A0A3S2UKL9_9SPHI|nr:thioredoxin-like domain-containing protein [Mucilaginibacter limnophilus]RVT99969.1 hypothetical protein EOD41_13470 [Mucilaginibacter limnophilus]
MKYLYIVITALIFTSCNKPDRIEIDGTAPAIKNGVFGVADVLGKPVYGVNMENGSFKISEQLEYPGFYQIKVSNMLDTKQKHVPYEVYLENGKYTFEINKDITRYPKIVTESKTQNELSAYYTLRDEMLAGVQQKIKDETAFFKSDAGKNLGGLDYVNRVDKFKALQQKEKDIEASVIEKFVEKYPESTVAAHLLYNLDYKSDPARYYAVYTKMSEAAKNTEEGKTLGEKLGGLSKLVEGQAAPAIYGKTPDGKAFDPKSVGNKKIILVDFWRAGNQVSRTNHLLIKDKVFFQVNNKKDFGVISINLDDNSDWWTKAVVEDKMNWPQYSDLKGNESKNAEAWGIQRIPTYYLVDGNWEIIKRDVAFDDVSYEVTEYLEK